MVHDGGTCFLSAFAEFLEANHDTRAYHPSSIGVVERGVCSLKDVLEKTEGHITVELIERLNFSINNHVTLGQGSAAMRFLGRSPRSSLPNSMIRNIDHLDLVKVR